MSKKKPKRTPKRHRQHDPKDQIYRPISWLPEVRYLVEGQLEHTRDQYESLLPARDKPHVLDDYTVDRVIRVFEEGKELNEATRRQIEHWLASPITDEERREVERLLGLLSEDEALVEKILRLAHELKGGTIERILEMSDEEVAFKTLTGELIRPTFDEDARSRLHDLGLEVPSRLSPLVHLGRALLDTCRSGKIEPPIKSHDELVRIVDGWLTQAREENARATEQGTPDPAIRELQNLILEVSAARRKIVF